ncbi:Taste receptor type 2 [Gossypium arboreum]|uniref:Uncharacterized protein n=2 Tax=Gossypium arboreum TaxID=29729 RepID=A0ABR0QIF2_GOSAR|nr:hypothetical protein PVK06_007841 [Gossypium arboreum]KHG04710.1 Taste receptor type 2 [Gossypium arboreum]
MESSTLTGKLEADIEIRLLLNSFTICLPPCLIMCTTLAITRFKDEIYMKMNWKKSVTFSTGVMCMMGRLRWQRI